MKRHIITMLAAIFLVALTVPAHASWWRHHRGCCGCHQSCGCNTCGGGCATDSGKCGTGTHAAYNPNGQVVAEGEHVYDNGTSNVAVNGSYNAPQMSAYAPTLTNDEAATYGYMGGEPTAVAGETALRNPAYIPGMQRPNAMEVATGGNPAAQQAFRAAMDKLWEDHITWTRNYIISAAADLPDKDKVAARLLSNQVDIGNAIKPYYGGDAGDQLTALLKDHILIAADVVAAAKANDSAKLTDANDRWFANADAIAAFLSQANPQWWPEATVRQMMHDHLNLTTQEATAQLKGDWDGSIAAYDQVKLEILKMSGALADGIINQFPDKF